jgi:hypothetical protein
MEKYFLHRTPRLLSICDRTERYFLTSVSQFVSVCDRTARYFIRLDLSSAGKYFLPLASRLEDRSKYFLCTVNLHVLCLDSRDFGSNGKYFLHFVPRFSATCDRLEQYFLQLFTAIWDRSIASTCNRCGEVSFSCYISIRRDSESGRKVFCYISRLDSQTCYRLEKYFLPVDTRVTYFLRASIHLDLRSH